MTHDGDLTGKDKLLLATVVLLCLTGLIALSYGIEVLRARIWAHEIRNAGCQPSPEMLGRQWGRDH